MVTLSNKKRYIPDINSKKSSRLSAAERQAINTICQGSGADFVKVCMLALDDYFTGQVGEHVCKLVLMLHDELVFEV